MQHNQMMKALALAALTSLPLAQDEAGSANTGFPGLAAGRAPRIEIPFNRLYDTHELYAHFDRLVAAYPDLLSRQVIGSSVQGREILVYTLNDPSSGPDHVKPAMWIDANIHGNEVQGGEVVLYTAWYLLENKGTNERVDELFESTVFYLNPTLNPDGRAHWFQNANTASSSRSGVAPIDSDRDGLFDEDPPNDLDGDGNIVQMRIHTPGEGTHRLSLDDERILERVGPGEKGDWTFVYSEGFDDDGDGRTNEDGLGGYDMNRSWPSFWQPEHVQGGAGPYPLYWPEMRSTANFILDHPNIAAAQSFHNNGGMILRGPGAEQYGSYPRSDVGVYDELGGEGERMLPFYRYMIIWSDLYTVFGGLVNWTYEGLGIFSFTNELWVSSRNSPDDRVGRSQEERLWFDDKLMSGAGFVDWHSVPHPLYGEVEVGGFVKDVGRVPPTFLIEEMLHRNAMFCLAHAEAMPLVELGEPELTELGDGLYAVDLRVSNPRSMPTRSAMAAMQHIGLPDVVELRGEGFEVLASGERSDDWRPERISLTESNPARIVLESGIPGEGERSLRWFVRGSGPARITWTGEKARDVALSFELGG